MEVFMQNSRTKDMVLTAVFSAVIAVLSQIAVPLGFTPVPVSLGTVGVFLAVGLLPFPSGVISVIVYLLLGVVGLPVFANFGSGIGTILGPTGGFLIGYAVAALIMGAILTKNSKTISVVLSLICASLIIYGCGVFGFMISTGSDLITTLTATVIPFLPGDIIKIAVCTVPIARLRKVTARQGVEV